MSKRKSSPAVDTPTKSKISRYYQECGGDKTRGAASQTARKFGLPASSGAARVKAYDKQVRDGTARRYFKGNCGRKSDFDEAIAQSISGVFKEDDTMTYREAAQKVGMSCSTLHRHATKNMDFRCLGQTVRPFPSESNREARLEASEVIVEKDGPVTNEFHQDEKYFICNSRRRKRKKRKSDTSPTITYAPHRRHQTQTMFSGCVGVGPGGEPIKIHFEWVSKKKTAKRGSKYHKRGDVFLESTTMDAAYFKKDLGAIGRKIRDKYTELGHPDVQVNLQIDSAGGHGTARGHGNFNELAAMMLQDFNIKLVKQPGNTPMFNVLDLTIWQSVQLEVDKMNKETRHREAELVRTCKSAWRALPGEKILQGFEMRKDAAAEALETEGWCPSEGKGRGGSKRVHTTEQYKDLRSRLGI